MSTDRDRLEFEQSKRVLADAIRRQGLASTDEAIELMAHKLAVDVIAVPAWPDLADATDPRFTDGQRAQLARFEAADVPAEVVEAGDVVEGPGGCNAALIVRGEHFWCDSIWPHDGWPHGSTAAEAIWHGLR